MNLSRIKQRAVLWSSILLLTLVATSSVLAQDVAACLRIIARSLAETGVNCANNELGKACYATGLIESVTEPDIDEETFDEPGENISLEEVITLLPDTVDLVRETWGITVFNMQANLPTNFDRDVVVVVLGGAEMESDVDRDNRFQTLNAPITVTTTSNSELRAVTLSDPDDADVIGQVTSGILLPADAISEDGDWARVIFQTLPAWISLTALEGDTGSLPTYGRNNMTPFQSFFVRSGVKASPCAQAPSLVLVQAPSEIPVDIIVNCVPIRIESTIVLRTQQNNAPTDTQLEVITLFGMATINADSDNPIYVPPGFSLPVGFDGNFVSLGIEGDEDEWGCTELSFGQPSLLTQQQISGLGIINRIPNNMLNYVISLPRLVIPSGIGQVIRRLIFNNPQALRIARRLCDANELPDNICDALGL